MEFKKIQQAVVDNAFRYGEEYNIRIDKDFALTKLYEEVGEFSQAILVHERKSRPEKYLPEEVSRRELANEIADVICMAIVNAQLRGIDVEEAIVKKWINKDRS